MTLKSSLHNTIGASIPIQSDVTIIMAKNLIFLAGKNAYKTIKDAGLHPDMVKTIAGAAGGPKWLVLNQFDRMLFPGFFKNRVKPLYLIGSSIGAWRFAAMCQSDPIDAQQRFTEAYINQQYSSKPTPSVVTAESLRIMKTFLSDKGIEAILNNPVFKIGFLSTRCKWPSSSDSKLMLGTGLLIALAANLVHRSLLNIQFERTLFHHPDINPPYLATNEFPINRIKLTTQNFTKALLSSGSIPLVMEGMKEITGAPNGTYRDGGLIDYHLDIPFQTESHDIVLYPHFTNRIVPGWLDKAFKWRKPKQDNMKNVLLVAPSTEYIAKLPYGKIPNRNDFRLYKNRDTERFKDWNKVVTEGKKLADEFIESVGSGSIKQVVQPL